LHAGAHHDATTTTPSLHAGAGTSTCALRAGTPQLTLPMLFDQPAWAERLQQMGVGRRLDPKEFEARGAVDYLVRQLRYVSMDEGVRASCELWKRTVLDEADGLGAVLAAVREAEIEAEIEAATKAKAKVDVKVEVNAAEVKAEVKAEAKAEVKKEVKAEVTAGETAPLEDETASAAAAANTKAPTTAPTEPPSSLAILVAAKAWKRARTDGLDEALAARNDEALDAAKPSPSSSSSSALWQPERVTLAGVGRSIWCHSPSRFNGA
jgi:hypothetical protein